MFFLLLSVHMRHGTPSFNRRPSASFDTNPRFQGERAVQRNRQSLPSSSRLDIGMVEPDRIDISHLREYGLTEHAFD